MDCKNIKESIYQWLDRELPDSQKREFLAHLERCPGCQKESQSIEAFHGVLKESFSAVEPSKDFERVFWQRVLERQKEPWFVRFLTGLGSLVPFPIASQAVAFLLVAFLIGGTGGAVSAMNASTSLDAKRASIQYLSGFREFKGIPFSSITVAYLKTIEYASST